MTERTAMLAFEEMLTHKLCPEVLTK